MSQYRGGEIARLYVCDNMETGNSAFPQQCGIHSGRDPMVYAVRAAMYGNKKTPPASYDTGGVALSNLR